jgi:hypothetical protein
MELSMATRKAITKALAVRYRRPGPEIVSVLERTVGPQLRWQQRGAA